MDVLEREERRFMHRDRLKKQARRKSRFSRILGACMSLVLATGLGTIAIVPDSAQAANGASVVIDKDVNGAKELRDLRPGDEFTYQIDFAANDDDADGPVTITDVLPAEFAGWQITGLIARFNGSETGLTLNLPEVTSGPAPAAPISGTLPLDPANMALTVEVALPVFPGTGNETGLGLPTGGSGVVSFSITVPTDIGTDDPILGTDIVNNARIDAFAGTRPISSSSTAVVEIVNPVLPEVLSVKTWAPAAQNYSPGEGSAITLEATQASSIPVNAIQMQDPADPGLTPDGATELAAGNPFNFVDFAGFASPADPSQSVPTGVDRVTVEVYHFESGVWSWVSWNSSMVSGSIAGVKIRYESDGPTIAEATVLTQSFDVVQRAEHRTTGESLIDGWELENTMSATISVAEFPDVTSQAQAAFAVVPDRVDVRTEKRFYSLPDGAERETLTASAGDNVGVVLRAANREAPYSSTLNKLVIAEPASGSSGDPATSPEYFGANLAFGQFDNSNIAEVWPTGATGGTITWVTAAGDEVRTLVTGAALPAPPAGAEVQGFIIEFVGEMPPASSSVIRYSIQTNESEAFVPDGQQRGPFLNRVEVTGESATLQPDTAQSTARLTLTAPRVDVRLSKSIGPQTVLPGQKVYVQLDTSVQASGSEVETHEIVIEDSLELAREAGISESSAFWNAFDLQQVLPPITRPLITSGAPGAQADLRIYLADASGVWGSTPWQTNPDANTAIDVPAGTTGIRYVYASTDRFSQSLFVKPNLSFQARETLRNDPSTSTGAEFPERAAYQNQATAEANGNVGSRDVQGNSATKQTAYIRGDGGDNSPKPGDGTWAAKTWSRQVLTAQSGASAYSIQNWAVVDPGFGVVSLQDPGGTTPSGQGTVFAAFDLTHIRPVGVTSTPTNGTQDARFAWDAVADVQLFDGAQWVSAPAPSGGWMNLTSNPDGGGFKGYVLTEEEQQTTLGIRLVIVENEDARQAAAAAGNIAAPAVGSGVSSSADVREYRMDWKLRNQARTSTGDLVWVTGDIDFNCDSDPGCVTNSLAAIGYVGGVETRRATAEAKIDIINGATNVGVRKQLQLLNPSTGSPVGAVSNTLELVAPSASDGIASEDYPRGRILITGTNTSEVPDGAAGAMQLARLRVTDSIDSSQTQPLLGSSMFDGRDFIAEAANRLNPFNLFNVTDVTFETLPDLIDKEQSSVEVWAYDGSTPEGESVVFTLQQVLDRDAAFLALLPEMVGVSTSFSVTDPEMNGNGIPAGTSLQMNLDVQLRATERVSGDAVVGGPLTNPRTIDNEVSARGWDVAVYPDRYIADTDSAQFLLRETSLEVIASKSISVSHGTVRNQTIYEPDPDAPVRVALGARSATTTAPIQRLRIEDDSEDFWSVFQLESIGEPSLPFGADTIAVEVKVGGQWVQFDGFSGDLEDVRGLRVDFTRVAGNGLFPDGAASWYSSWGSASVPMNVVMRADADVDWQNGSETNTVQAEVSAPDYETATDEASSTVTFSPGTPVLRVEKHAPNETDGHQVDPLGSYPWDLTFTNTGNSFIPIASVTDELPATLSWSGDAPSYQGTPGTRGLTGLTSDGAEINLTLSEDQRSLTFTWPDGQRMYPGEVMTVRVNLVLSPVPTGTQAINSVVVKTGIDLATCVQPTDRGQMPQAREADNECSNRNFVVPRLGTGVSTVKSSFGESVDTLGEDLVQGAFDTRTGDSCTLPLAPLVPEGYTRYPCAAQSVVGGTDSWSLQNANTASSDLSRMVVVDMLPRPGDRLLGGGAERDSTYRPVLRGESLEAVFNFTGLPDGTEYTIEVTTNVAACIGSDPNTSLWVDDPTCEDLSSNPANVWVSSDAFTGSWNDIAGVRFAFDMTVNPLKPAEHIGIEFDTVNIVGDGSDEALAAQLDRFSTDQFAWNQDGVVAWNTDGVRVILPVAPRRAGVMIATQDLVVSKEMLGEGVAYAPEAFEVELSCTVPSGLSDPERVQLDMGEFSSISVPAGGSVTVPGIPIGADCSIAEVGELGTYGETGRSIREAPGVSAALDGMSADISVRVQESGVIEAQLTNTYTVGGLTVEKAVLSTNSDPVPDDQSSQSFVFELNCDVPGGNATLSRTFNVIGGSQHVESDLPVGARCVLQETHTFGALGTSIATEGVLTEGVTSTPFMIDADGSFALVSNEFAGVAPAAGDPLERTGSSGGIGIAIAVAILLLAGGAAAFVISRSRKRTGK